MTNLSSLKPGLMRYLFDEVLSDEVRVANVVSKEISSFLQPRLAAVNRHSLPLSPLSPSVISLSMRQAAHYKSISI